MHRRVYLCQRERNTEIETMLEYSDELLNEYKRKENMKINTWKNMIKVTQPPRTWKQ